MHAESDPPDVHTLPASGWKPVPIREFILKLVGNCNLACDYCYVYTKADQSWRSRPMTMSAATLTRTCERIREHVDRHALRAVRVVLHGGEPLLAGAAGIDAATTTIRQHLGPPVRLDLGMQTNAVLLHDPVLRVLRRHGVRVGVSLDGDRDSHDRHRVTTRSRGSHAATLRGLRRLGQPAYRDLFSGLLCVVDVRNDPLAVYEALLEHGPPSVDLLLPHANWSDPPPGRDAGGSATPYAEWLIAIFDRWYSAPVRETRIVLFEEIINLLLGGASRSEQVGLAPVAFLVVDTDGSLQQVDSLKSSRPGAPETGLTVFDATIDDALAHPGVRARQQGLAALADTCRRCPIVRVCGGGHYAHRFRLGRGYRNPSVYCRDLVALIDHIRRRLTADVQKPHR